MKFLSVNNKSDIHSDTEWRVPKISVKSYAVTTDMSTCSGTSTIFLKSMLSKSSR